MNKLYETIKQQDFYTARQVAELGFIKDHFGHLYNYNFVLQQIREKQLTASNVLSHKKRPLYKVRATDIIDYLERVNKH